MLTLIKEKTSLMGNGPINGEKQPDEEFQETEILKNFLPLTRRKSADGLIFYASTDKARVITEILEERGWYRTKDHSETNFTIKWCHANQVDWNQFQEGKQLINNIPGQLAFADKINLWYTIRDYLRDRRTFDGNHIQTFLPMTFVLDDENEVAEFLRSYKKQNRTWICKPRYSYAGRGIYLVSVNSELNTIFKFSVGTNNRPQYQPRLPGYLMQEYIARPLLIKGRKFDIRVHWLVAWTKPYLVFYNHNASVVRLSLNLYREFDFDRATHLTNLSVQENHHRYAFAHEATGMTMSQLNHYFNQCFRPFHPKMCQDWVLTVMQERMQTIIRHVIRASKDKLTRGAGHFGLFGCDFLLDENFRIWLLEINDNPGVGWGNPRVNTTTKPLFEETLNIVLECFDKYKKNETLLPIKCLHNYQLIYNEDDDTERISRDDNQLFSERLSIRYGNKDIPSRASFHRLLPRVNTSRTSTNQSENKTNDSLFPIINLKNTKSSITDTTTSIADSTLPKTPIINTPPENVSIVNTTPLSPSLLRETAMSVPIYNRTPSTSPIPNAVPLTPAITDTIPFSPITVDTTNERNETIESFKHDDDIELELLMKSKTSKPKPPLSSLSTTTRSTTKTNKLNPKRTLTSSNPFGIQRKKPIDLTAIVVENRRYTYRLGLTPPLGMEPIKKEKKTSKNKLLHKDDEQDNIDRKENQSIITTSTNLNQPELCFFN